MEIIILLLIAATAFLLDLKLDKFFAQSKVVSDKLSTIIDKLDASKSNSILNEISNDLVKVKDIIEVSRIDTLIAPSARERAENGEKWSTTLLKTEFKNFDNSWRINIYKVVLIKPEITQGVFLSCYEAVTSIISITLTLPFPLPSKREDFIIEICGNVTEVVRTKTIADEQGIYGQGEAWDITDLCVNESIDLDFIIQQLSDQTMSEVRSLSKIPNCSVTYEIPTEALLRYVYHKSMENWIAKQIDDSSGELSDYAARNNFARAAYPKYFRGN